MKLLNVWFYFLTIIKKKKSKRSKIFYDNDRVTTILHGAQINLQRESEWTLKKYIV